ncbi:hypothetical protein AAFG13_02120 [Bradyrhizobium sp. B124]|uniref:hypothetical protein n=1 Tax=Bradyrhizobium sp. B124 TaxID=3140245 RepID=UPI0031837428
MKLIRERAEGITFSNVKDVKKKAQGRILSVVPRLDRGTQYAAASRLITAVSGILDRPVEPGDDS